MKKHELLTPFHDGGKLSNTAIAELKDLLTYTPSKKEVARVIGTALTVMKDVYERESKSSFHGQRVRADLEQGIEALTNLKKALHLTEE